MIQKTATVPSSACCKLICQFEGFCATPYLCPAKVWTIGYGTTEYPWGEPVRENDPVVTQTQALALLEYAVKEFTEKVLSLVNVPLRQCQLDAVISLVYNIGLGAFSSSTLLKKLNAADYLGASAEFLRWNKSRGAVLPGLTRRRKAEFELFIGDA